MELHNPDTPAQDQPTPNQPTQPPEKKRRFKLVRLEERIAPVGSATNGICPGTGHAGCGGTTA
jgi:hypothetical protein